MPTNDYALRSQEMLQREYIAGDQLEFAGAQTLGQGVVGAAEQFGYKGRLMQAELERQDLQNKMAVIQMLDQQRMVKEQLRGMKLQNDAFEMEQQRMMEGIWENEDIADLMGHDPARRILGGPGNYSMIGFDKEGRRTDTPLDDETAEKMLFDSGPEGMRDSKEEQRQRLTIALEAGYISRDDHRNLIKTIGQPGWSSQYRDAIDRNAQGRNEQPAGGGQARQAPQRRHAAQFQAVQSAPWWPWVGQVFGDRFFGRGEQLAIHLADLTAAFEAEGLSREQALTETMNWFMDPQNARLLIFEHSPKYEEARSKPSDNPLYLDHWNNLMEDLDTVFDELFRAGDIGQGR